MRLRSLKDNNYGSIYPILIFIMILCLVSFIVLIFNEIYTPFHQLIRSNDTIIDADFDAPRVAMAGFIDSIWPKGVLLGIMIICGMAAIMEYQKRKYQGG